MRSSELQDQEGMAMRAFLQGMLYMMTHQYLLSESSIVRTKEVRQEAGEHGIYEPHFTIITESGFKYRVELIYDGVV